MRKLTLVLLPVLFVIALLFTFHYLVIDFNKLLSDSGAVLWDGFILFSLFRIYSKGIFRKTNWVMGAYLATAMFIVGSLFIIQRWSGGAILLYSGCLLASAFYTIHFIRKNIKSLI